ncbi:MAG: L-seryl-tRNA(Sec) selenium transferase, partial [Actinomycetota bacterium]
MINATGVILHTGLGRAPLPSVAARALDRASTTYTDLELDLATGERGRRSARAETMLRALTDAEDALVVKNGAAAHLLAHAALGGGKQVIVSRGELVEIGGGFRIPDILRASGAKLVEVGTTNRTRVA